jgi:hypothetical protein
LAPASSFKEVLLSGDLISKALVFWALSIAELRNKTTINPVNLFFILNGINIELNLSIALFVGN